MNTTTILLVLLVLATFGYFLGRKRSLAVSNGNKGANRLHSLPGYYGYLVAIWCVIPALLVLLLWNAVNHTLITQNVVSTLPVEVQEASKSEIGLLMNRVESMVAAGEIDSSATPQQQAAAGLHGAADHQCHGENRGGTGAGADRFLYWLALYRATCPGAQQGRDGDPLGDDPVCVAGDSDHPRHCAVGAV
ncbi:MAG: phosphate ABC transporter permease family protein [Thiolinea sp.]